MTSAQPPTADLCIQQGLDFIIEYLSSLDHVAAHRSCAISPGALDISQADGKAYAQS